jgi:hypothetical protein
MNNNKDLNVNGRMSVISKCATLNQDINTDLETIHRISKAMNIEKFYIFSIVICDELEYEVTHIDNIKYINIGFRYFIDNILGNPDGSEFKRNNPNCLYILRNSNYSDMNIMFNYIANKDVRVTRGSSHSNS